MRYESKSALVSDIVAQHDALCGLIRSVPDSRYREPGVWGDGWSIQDLVAHLTEWHRMFLRWYDAGLRGDVPVLPAPGYKWNQTPELNRTIWSAHKDEPWEAVWTDFSSSYERVLAVAESSSEAELLKPGRFTWTGKNPLRTYLGANTASHYRFAMKVIKRWQRGVVRGAGPEGGRR